MPKWAKLIVAILLVPLCLGACKALWLVFRSTGSAETTWVPMLAGAACWLVVFALLPKPMWIYVVGHELTHAVWTWIFGGRVKKFKATAKGGHVVITKTNFVISLAPYFFPLYAVILTVLFFLGHLVWNWKGYLVWFHLLLGAAYAFHLTLTCYVLGMRQTDVTEQGYFFSFVVIFLGNILVLLMGLPLLTHRVGLLTALGWWLECTGQIFQRLGHVF